MRRAFGAATERLELLDAPPKIADPLAQPTRARLFTLLGELRGPTATDELAARLGMHVNGVRTHLETLADAGLIVREREQQARGRPRDAWRISPGAKPGGALPTGYTELSRWLVRSLVANGSSPEDLERVGEEIGSELAAESAPGDPEAQMFDALVALGFAPERERTGEDSLQYCLGNCPYRDTAREKQSLICGLHRGLTSGLIDGLSLDSSLKSFVPKDPDTAGCLVEIQGPAAQEKL